ncbi:lasso RiPP family leader peptide-containing protein [Blastococcus sp. SYSU D00820]
MKYATPQLRKLGTLSELTLGSGGSAGDGGSKTRGKNQPVQGANNLLGNVAGN